MRTEHLQVPNPLSQLPQLSLHSFFFCDSDAEMICSINSVHRTMLSIIQYVIDVNLQSAFLIILTLSSFSHSLLFLLDGSLQFPLLTKNF